MSLELNIAALTEAINRHADLVAENTAVLRTFKGDTPAALTKAAKPVKEKPASETPAPDVVETPAPDVVEMPAPAVVETSAPAAEPEAPVLEIVEPETDPEDYSTWDEPKLRLAVVEFCKLKIVQPDKDKASAFKAAFDAELASHGAKKTKDIPFEKLAAFYTVAQQW